MRVVVSGATGLVGYPIAKHLVNLGMDVTTLGRRASSLGVRHLPWELDGNCPDLGFADALVHAAFDHIPGRYRGGEGSDPEGFMRRNQKGTLRVFDAARGSRIVFLSSRAIYGSYPSGTRLTERMTPQPDTLYGALKTMIEEEVSMRGGVSLRATGVYGPTPPGRENKWSTLFADFRAGRAIAPRVATEVHADDVAAAVAIALRHPEPAIFNVSDIVLDRRDLLQTYRTITGHRGDLPPRAKADDLCEMDTARLRQLGWTPQGWGGVAATLRAIT